jgi:hypothetical protein
VLERQRREERGHQGLPEESPLEEAPAAWADWYPDWRAFFLGNVMANAYHGVSLDRMGPAEREAAVASAERVRRLASRNDALAILAGVLFVGLATFLALRLRPQRAAALAPGEREEA